VIQRTLLHALVELWSVGTLGDRLELAASFRGVFRGGGEPAPP